MLLGSPAYRIDWTSPHVTGEATTDTEAKVAAVLAAAASAIEDSFKPAPVSTGALSGDSNRQLYDERQCKPAGYRRRSRVTAIIGTVGKAR